MTSAYEDASTFLLYRGKLVNVTQIRWAGTRTDGVESPMLQVEFITGGWCSWPDDPDATIEDFAAQLYRTDQGVVDATPKEGIK